MPIKFVFLIVPHVHLLDIAGPDQTLLEAIEYGANFTIEYCGILKTPISSSGLSISTPMHFSKVHLNEGDFLILPGGNVNYLTSDPFKAQQGLFTWIRACHLNKVNLVSICSGAFILAESGILDHRACTTHFKQTAHLQKIYPKICVKENILFTEDHNIYTSAGISSGIDLTLHLIEKLMGSYFTLKVAREMLIYIRRTGNTEQQSVFLQYRNHIHSGIHRAQDFTIEYIHKKNNLMKLAHIACMSERNFTRIFKKETGITVKEYVTRIRVEKIKNYMSNPDLSKIQIAKKVGLDSEKQLTRLLHM